LNWQTTRELGFRPNDRRSPAVRLQQLALTGLTPQEYFKQANDFSVIVAMIETREAIAAVDDILAVPACAFPRRDRQIVAGA
jgi:2-keto-3-deoxy-L-rhamnonate aldolase RhmA